MKDVCLVYGGRARVDQKCQQSLTTWAGAHGTPGTHSQGTQDQIFEALGATAQVLFPGHVYCTAVPNFGHISENEGTAGFPTCRVASQLLSHKISALPLTGQQVAPVCHIKQFSYAGMHLVNLQTYSTFDINRTM